MAETVRERHDRLQSKFDKDIAGFVNGEKPRPMGRYVFDKFGRKKYASFEDYLNG